MDRSSFDVDRFRSALETERLGRPFRWLGACASTMDEAHADLEAGAPDGALVLADAQSEGRGSRGARWESRGGENLTFSFVLRQRPGGATLTLAVGLGLARAVDGLLERPGAARVKWPNDVWVGEPAKKLAGILVEARSAGGRAPKGQVVGVGLNVNQMAFPPGLLATSLALEAGRAFERETVLAALLRELEAALRLLEDPAAVARAVEERLLWRGEEVEAGALQGRLTGLGPDGALLLRTRHGPREVRAGRVRPAS